MIKVRLVATGLVFLMICGIISGCSSWKYHATLYDDAEDWINETFQKENMVSGAYYINKDFIYGVSNPEDEETYIQYTTLPSDRLFIITEEEEYDRVFSIGSEELGLDFEDQILIVYTFPDTTRKNRLLVDMNLKDGVLEITHKKEKTVKEYFAPVGDTCMPYQRWFVVKMDKLAIHSVSFKKSNS